MDVVAAVRSGVNVDIFVLFGKAFFEDFLVCADRRSLGEVLIGFFILFFFIFISCGDTLFGIVKGCFSSASLDFLWLRLVWESECFL